MLLKIFLREKKYQGARYNLRGVFDLTILFVMQLVNNAERRKGKKEVTQEKMKRVLMTNWQHGFFFAYVICVLTDRYITCYAAYKLNRTGCATKFVSAQRTVMLLLPLFFSSVSLSYSKCCRKIDR